MQQPQQQWVPTYIMEQKIHETRVRLIRLICFISVLVGISMFLLGYSIADNKWYSWYQSNCIAYPFLLVSPNNHVACQIPTP